MSSVFLSGFEFDPIAWAEESYEAAVEIYKVLVDCGCYV